jgi:hypothetical protein
MVAMYVLCMLYAAVLYLAVFRKLVNPAFIRKGPFHWAVYLCNLKILVNPAFIGKAPFYKGKPLNCEMNYD